MIIFCRLYLNNFAIKLKGGEGRARRRKGRSRLPRRYATPHPYSGCRSTSSKRHYSTITCFKVIAHIRKWCPSCLTPSLDQVFSLLDTSRICGWLPIFKILFLVTAWLASLSVVEALQVFLQVQRRRRQRLQPQEAPGAATNPSLDCLIINILSSHFFTPEGVGRDTHYDS